MKLHSEEEIVFLADNFPYQVEIPIPAAMRIEQAKVLALKLSNDLAIYNPPIPVRVYGNSMYAFFKDEATANRILAATKEVLQVSKKGFNLYKR